MTHSLKLILEERLGKRIRYPKECDALAEQINESIGMRISSSTLKRIFGFITPASSPSLYTLDVLSCFLGFQDWEDLENEMQGRFDGALSHANKSSGLPDGLESGKLIEVCYQPDRRLVLQHIGKESFRVVQSEKSALKENDVIETRSLIMEDYLFFHSVCRGTKNLGSFISPRNCKIISISLQ